MIPEPEGHVCMKKRDLFSKTHDVEEKWIRAECSIGNK